MSNNILKYKNYVGSVKISLDDGIVHGKIEFINDLITYQADGPAGLELSFQEAVDDYLETCEMLGREPQKSMSGSFNVRVGEDLHKRVAIKALDKGIGLNDFVKTALEASLADGGSEKEFHLHLHHDDIATKENYGRISKEIAIPKWDPEIATIHDYQAFHRRH